MKKLALVIGVIAAAVVMIVMMGWSESPVELHNRGIALIYRHDFAAAEEPLRRLVQIIDDDSALWINLGIAQLNQESKLDAAGTKGCGLFARLMSAGCR